jgi:hypothetical protein
VIIKSSVLLLLLFMSVIFCSCAVITDSNHEYKFEEDNDNSGDLYLFSGSFYKVDADTLLSYSEKVYLDKVSIPSNAMDAAQIGASILDKEYEEWSESKTVVAHFNKLANAWIIHGQLPNRYSTGNIGVIAIEASTGEVLCIVCESGGT